MSPLRRLRSIDGSDRRTWAGIRRPGTVRMLLVTAATIVAALPAAAQTSELAIEVGGSRILPPADVEGDAAAFLVAGLRGSRYDFGGTGVYASLLFGRAVDALLGGDFLSLDAGGSAWRSLGAAWSAGLEGRVFGFRVQDPFPYDAGAIEGSAVLRYRSGALSARLAGTAGVGQSRMTITSTVRRMRREVSVEEVLEDDLWRWGGTVEALAGGGALAAGVAGGLHRSAGGTYRSAGLRLVGGGGAGALELRADVWRTPFGNETTAGIAFYVPWGPWSVRGVAGKPDPDPMLLTEPAQGAGGLLFGRRILGSGPAEPGPEGALHRVTGRRAEGARVRFTLESPGGADSVAVLGDFTLWEPVPMALEDGHWTVELELPAGTHHFGFLVDGTWYLPDDAPDAVPDEWGRRSATLVIEGEDGPSDAASLDPRGAGER